MAWERKWNVVLIERYRDTVYPCFLTWLLGPVV